MHVLISNDDGFRAPGLAALADALAGIARCTVVAPDRDRSGASNSLTLSHPLRAQRQDNGHIAVEGTPTDCVHLGINGLLDEAPEMVVTGVNAGANMGDDVHYSGTVAGAMEGRFLGLPAIAFSLAGSDLRHYDTAARVARTLIDRLQAAPLPPDTILNVNVPDCPHAELRGWRVTRLGNRHRSEPVIVTHDPRGRRCYWIGPPGAEQDAGPGTDFDAVANGWVSLTPLATDMTRHPALPALEEWLALCSDA
ncbi:MAG: 5'/3'-nucleotidase SurE [Halofilum sp. (in: g-proteobacteria)]|nr:5'/3'-nucleotidase SurE [Halofilum sp. (in: g-proteobacteria)]